MICLASLAFALVASAALRLSYSCAYVNDDRSLGYSSFGIDEGRDLLCTTTSPAAILVIGQNRNLALPLISEGDSIKLAPSVSYIFESLQVDDLVFCIMSRPADIESIHVTVNDIQICAYPDTTESVLCLLKRCPNLKEHAIIYAFRVVDAGGEDTEVKMKRIRKEGNGDLKTESWPFGFPQ